jgi:hypothetical protein
MTLCCTASCFFAPRRDWVDAVEKVPSGMGVARYLSV